jgi:hypothetical protein
MSSFDVWVLRFESDARDPVRSLMHVFRIDEGRAQRILDSIPCTVKRGVSSDMADRIAALLQDLGAEVAIKPALSTAPLERAQAPTHVTVPTDGRKDAPRGTALSRARGTASRAPAAQGHRQRTGEELSEAPPSRPRSVASALPSQAPRRNSTPGTPAADLGVGPRVPLPRRIADTMPAHSLIGSLPAEMLPDDMGRPVPAQPRRKPTPSLGSPLATSPPPRPVTRRPSAARMDPPPIEDLLPRTGTRNTPASIPPEALPRSGARDTPASIPPEALPRTGARHTPDLALESPLPPEPIEPAEPIALDVGIEMDLPSEPLPLPDEPEEEEQAAPIPELPSLTEGVELEPPIRKHTPPPQLALDLSPPPRPSPRAEPPLVEPALAQPPQAQPPLAQPPQAQPPQAQPPLAQPPLAQPPLAQPPLAQPPLAQPPLAKPPPAEAPPGQPGSRPFAASLFAAGTPFAGAAPMAPAATSRPRSAAPLPVMPAPAGVGAYLPSVLAIALGLATLFVRLAMRQSIFYGNATWYIGAPVDGIALAAFGTGVAQFLRVRVGQGGEGFFAANKRLALLLFPLALGINLLVYWLRPSPRRLSGTLTERIDALQTLAATCRRTAAKDAACADCCGGGYAFTGVCECLVPSRCSEGDASDEACARCCKEDDKTSFRHFSKEHGCVCNADRSLFD